MEHSMDKKMDMESQMYYRFGGMIFLSFIAMYILMYAMVNSFTNVFSSFNQFYMAGLMTTPMVILELIVMGIMYPNKKLNTILIVLGGILGIVFWLLIRNQIGIEDKQFVRSMIPHHGGAVLMCENANLQDEELKTFCQNIIAGQNGEIEQMKKIMERLEKQ
jgi:hypothetical protein